MLFPASDAGYADAIASGGTVFPPSLTAAGVAPADVRGTPLLARAVEHFVAAAEGFNADLNAHSIHLRGVPIVGGYSVIRKTTVLGNRPTGIFGKTAAFISVNEGNHKGNSHNHELDNAGIPSWGLQVLASEPSLAPELKRLIDVWSSSELSSSVHIMSLLRRSLGIDPYKGPWANRKVVVGLPASVNAPALEAAPLLRYAPPPLTAHALHTQQAAERVQPHGHGSRCHEGAFSAVQCSQAMGKELRPEDGSAGAEQLLTLKPVSWGCISSSATPLPTSLDPLAASQMVIAVENTRGYPAPGPIDRIGSNYSEANEDELNAAYIAALQEADDVCDALKGLSTPADTNVMDFVDNDAVASALDALLGPASVLQEADDVEDAGADTAGSRDDVEDAVRQLVRAVNRGGMVSSSVLVTLIDSLPASFKSALKKALLSRNTRITDYNDVITALRGCNTAIYVISSGVAAMVAMFYLLEYITKNPGQRESSLSIALAAHEKTLKVCRHYHISPSYQNYTT